MRNLTLNEKIKTKADLARFGVYLRANAGKACI
jgi:hypothetical protein